MTEISIPKNGRAERGVTYYNDDAKVIELVEKGKGWLSREGAIEAIEEILTHETIHDVLLKTIGFEAQEMLDNITHWNLNSTRLLIGLKQKKRPRRASKRGGTSTC